MSDRRAVAHAMTKEEYDEAMVGRQRPMTQGPMRIRESVDETPNTHTLSDLERLIEKRAPS